MLYKIKKVIGLSISLFFLHTAHAQRVYDTTTTNIMSEIDLVQAYLQTSSHLSFNAVYYFEDIDSVAVYDTLQASYEMNADKYHIIMDSVETIQNEKYLVTVYNQDKLVVVQDPESSSRQVMHVNIMDSTFQQLAMYGMTAADSGIFRKITLFFDANALYTNYEMVYNKTTYQLLYIKYALRKETEPESDKRFKMFIKFSNYKTGEFTDAVFSTDPYLTVTSSKGTNNGSLTANYEVVNLQKEQ